MSGNLDDLEFSLGVDIADSLKGLREVVSSLNQVQANIGALVPAYNDLNAATMRLATSGSLPVKNAELLMAGMGSIGNTIERLDGQMQRMDTRLETAVVASTDLSEHWQYINRDVKASTDKMRQFAEQSRQAAQAVQTIVVDTANNKMQPKQQPQQSGFELVKLASAALAVKAVGSVSNAMTTARTAIASIDTTTKTAVLSLDRFRMGLAAPAVNPALNTLPGLIGKISGGVANAVESFRGFGDATISGAPAIMSAIAGGMQKVLGSGDSLQATVSKITSQLDLHRGALDRVAKIYPTTGTAVGMLKDAMNFIAPAAEAVAQKVDAANATIRDTAISARNLAFIATGSFIKTGTSADLYARGAYHALLPTRLMAFEAKFAATSMGLVRRAFNLVTSPVHAVQMALQRSRGEFRELRANLPQLTGGLQIGTRAMRAFAHTTLATSQAIATLKTAVSPITFIASSLWNLVRPAKAAKVGLDGVVTGGHKAGIVLRGLSSVTATAASGLKTVANAGSQAATSLGGGMMGSITSKAGMVSMALAGIGVAAAGMAGSTAMAVEKNQAVFGVMLGDMEQGRAVVASLQSSAAVGLFDNTEVMESGRLLFKAGVAAVDLKGKTEQLATIAAATSTELSDLTRIYQQGANRGSFGQDKINQLAERGIDIYHALTAVTGASGQQLADMISGGKIGIAEMDAAMAHMTEANGIYSGSLATLGNTTSGMLSQIKTNLIQALGGVGESGVSVFTPLLQMAVAASEGVKNTMLSVMPIVTQVFTTIQSVFTGVWSVISGTFTAIFGSFSGTFGSMLGMTMEWVTKFRWYFENLLPITQFVWMNFALMAVTAFNDVAYFFTDVFPAYFGWFVDNAGNIFTDLGNIVVTVMSNLASNIKTAFTEIWDFIASGGTDSMEFAFVPLLDGFEATVAELPKIAERATTDLEAGMQTSIEAIGTQLADSFDALNMEAQVALVTPPPAPVEINPNMKSDGQGTGEDGATTGGNKRTSFLVSNLEKGSQAALDAIFAGQKDKTSEKQLSEQKMTNKHLAKIASKPAPAVLEPVT